MNPGGWLGHRTVRACSLAWLGLFFLLGAPRAEPPGPSEAERLLKAAGVATDGPGLLAFIRSHTLSEAELDDLEATARQLGDVDFEMRQQASERLVAAGRAALPLLRPALADPDLEVARRAERCLEEIQQQPPALLLTAAAELLAERRPAGAAAVLLAYLPCADDESAEEVWWAALLRIGLVGGRPDPAVLAALSDRWAVRRAAAAHVLGQAAQEEARRRIVPLLADADARVRYEAASSLVRQGNRDAVPVLLALLSEAPVPLACRAEQLLCAAAAGRGPDAGSVAGDGEARRKCRAGWETWWREHGAGVDLGRLRHEETLRGLTAICEYDGGEGTGRVWEYGADGNKRWELPGLPGPNDVQVLPGGGVLVAERNGHRVTEYDPAGRVLWRHPVSGSPITCQRLPGGSTLVATFHDLYEVSRDHQKVHSHKPRGELRHARRLANGHVVYITSQAEVVELDSAWKEVRAIRPSAHAEGAAYWASVEALPNGRFLLALGGAGRVIEIDGNGKVKWECEVPSAVFATRLSNGRTLVCSFEGRCLIEVDRTGKEIARQVLQGRPFAVRRY
jgi:HEAT repeat protein